MPEPIESLPPCAPPLQRFSADVHRAFAPHRHDTYTFALTLRGVQSFDYRGETRHSQPGGVVVLHPDEVHDGRPGTPDGFSYAALTLRPDWLVRIRPGRGLPFLPGGLSRDPRLVQAVTALHRLPDTASPLETETALIELAQALDALCDAPAPVQRFVREQVDLVLERAAVAARIIVIIEQPDKVPALFAPGGQQRIDPVLWQQVEVTFALVQLTP